MAAPTRGRPKNPPKPKKILREILPLDDIFTEEEKIVYNNLIEVYLQDFEEDDLSSSDVDDIIDLAKNRVLEIRLLKSSKTSSDKQVDVSAAIERLSKENKKIKENLSSRRKDRIEPNKYKGFSIVDLAVAFDEQKKEKMKETIQKNKMEEQFVIESRKSYYGNRYDSDTDTKDEGFGSPESEEGGDDI
jgi:hypothetical protein